VLLRAFEALRAQVPAELTVVGASEPRVAPLLVERDGVTALGRVPTTREARALRAADVLCAPSLGGESFGMVLTEAFAAGHAGRRLRHRGLPRRRPRRRDGLLVPRGDATALAETLRDLALDPARDARWRRGARERGALRLAARRRAGRDAYEDARAVPAPGRRARRAAVRDRPLPADGGRRAPARRLPSLEPPAGAGAPARARGARSARRARDRPAPTRARAHRARADRPRARALEPAWVLVGARADVRLDAAARGLLARDPQGRAAGRAPRFVDASRARRSGC
jgi:phosphatidylinositol alpha-mannosyltransferase